MNYDKAVHILEIESQTNEKNPICLNLIKKQYRCLALKYHPDKNNTDDALGRFQEINEAYNYLLKTHSDNLFEYSSDEDDAEDEIKETDIYNGIDKNSYSYHLFTFIKNVLSTEMSETSGNELKNPIFKLGNKILFSILKKLENKCEESLFEMLKKIDKTVLLRLQILLLKHRDSLHIQEDFFEKLNEIIKNKLIEDECIILNPLINDLFEHKVYKFSLNNKTIIVPLWHHELIYDNSGGELIVQCIPILPDNIFIDNNNDVHIDLQYRIQELFGLDFKEFSLGNKKIQFPVGDVRLKRFQILRLGKCGIPKINTGDVYDYSYISDVFIHLELLL